MKTYTYKLKPHKKNKILHTKINAAGVIWNRLVRIMERHRRMFYKRDATEVPAEWVSTFERMRENKRYKGHPFSSYRSYNLLQRIRNGSGRFSHVLNELDAQTIQQLTQRVERAYKLFFTKLKHGERRIEPVKTKNPNYYPSFTMQKSGYKFDWLNSAVRISKDTFRFFADRIPGDKIKTVTVKRDNLKDLWLYVVTGEVDETQTKDTRPVVGIDLWVQPMLTLSDGTRYQLPTFYTDALAELRRIDKSLSKKREEAKKRADPESEERTPPSNKYLNLREKRARIYRDIANKRREHHIQLARELSQKYGAIAIVDAPVKRLQRLSGFKVSDTSPSLLLSWLDAQCAKTGTKLIKVPGRLELLKICHNCGHMLEKAPKKGEWVCPECGNKNERELNIAQNIGAIAIKILEAEALEANKTAS